MALNIDHTTDKLTPSGGTLTIPGSLVLPAAGNGIKIKEGSNARMGIATLVGGTVTISTTAVAANSRIFLTVQGLGGTLGLQYISAIVAGTSFTITSLNILDTSTVAWLIVDPAP